MSSRIEHTPERSPEKAAGPARRSRPAVTATTLTTLAGLSAVVAGALFTAVQINHPHVDLALVTTTEWKVRQAMKVVLAPLALAGVTGIYLRQVRQMGALGLVGYLLFAGNFLIMLSVEIVGLVVFPVIARTSPDYVRDVLAVATNGHAIDEIGLMQALNLLSAVGYLGGGLLFGVALFRAKVLPRWASGLLAVGTMSSLLIPVLPAVNYRLFAIPTGIALIGLGCALWWDQRTPTGVRVTTAVGTPLDASATP